MNVDTALTKEWVKIFQVANDSLEDIGTAEILTVEIVNNELSNKGMMSFLILWKLTTRKMCRTEVR